jgi:hypothetical protein
MDGKQVGTGRPGEVTMRLYEALASRLAAVAGSGARATVRA